MSTYKAQVLTPWQENAAGQSVPLDELLGAGDSCMDVTGQPVDNLLPDPNLTAWEVWAHDPATLTAIEDDPRFFVVMSWEEPDEIA